MSETRGSKQRRQAVELPSLGYTQAVLSWFAVMIVRPHGVDLMVAIDPRGLATMALITL